MIPTTPRKRMGTRPSNPKHPAYKVGAAAPARKRRTRTEVAEANEAKAAQAAEAEKARQAKLQRVANLEDRLMVEESTIDITPRPQRPLPRSRSRRAETHIGASSGESEGSDTISDEACAQVCGVGDTDPEEDARPPTPKRAKVQKTRVRRDGVEKARSSIDSDGKEKRDANSCEARPSSLDARHIMKKVSPIEPSMGTDKLKLYKNRDSSASFVFSFAMPSNLSLTLDENTLHYYNNGRGIDDTNSISDYINNWIHGVRSAPASKPSSTSTRLGRRRDQSLASRSTQSSKSSGAPVKNTTTEEDGVQMGGISDEDEIHGLERDFAIKSPLKGKKRLTSEVCFKSLFHILFTVVLMYIQGHC
jgi:hypothetical protein